MKTMITFLFFFVLCLSSCKKDGKGCWQGWDHAGVDAAGYLFCDISKSEAEEKFPGMWFYKQGETKYCWRAENGGNPIYWIDMPESIRNRYAATGGYGSITKIDCNSICNCQWVEKHKGKLTGEFKPSRIIYEWFLSADTCSKLTVGRVITVRETADSLITRDLIKKLP